MLINQENIQQRFNENLEWATEIDLATAWATIHDGLQALQSHTPPLKVRAVVGLWGNATDPEALTKLSKIGELRLVDKSGFHPKVYVFRGQAKAVAWIGSANFTNSGFGMNQEALFETRNIQDVEKWFDNLWEQCGSLDEYAIGRYAESRLTNPPQHSTRPTRVAESDPLQTPLELLKQGTRRFASTAPSTFPTTRRSECSSSSWRGSAYSRKLGTIRRTGTSGKLGSASAAGGLE